MKKAPEAKAKNLYLPVGEELYELLDLAGKEGVKQRVRAILRRPGSDVHSLKRIKCIGLGS